MIMVDIAMVGWFAYMMFNNRSQMTVGMIIGGAVVLALMTYGAFKEGGS